MNSSTEAPPWWGPDLAEDCIQLASNGLPNEICGWFIQHPMGMITPMILPASASPTFVTAQPDAVIHLVYRIEQEGCAIVGTFHSHPLGRPTFSQTDAGLALWGKWHALAVREAKGWRWVFATRMEHSIS